MSDHGCIPTLLFDGAVQLSLDRGRPERTLHLMGRASPGSWQLHYPGTLNLALLKLLPLSFEKHFIACANTAQPSHGASCFTAYGLLPRFGIRDHILEACWVGKTSPSWSPRQCCSSTYCNCTNPWPQTWPSVVRRFHQICPPWWVLAFVRDCPGAVGLWVRGAVRIGQSRALRERCLLPSSFVHEMSGIHAGVNKPVASVPLEPVHHQYSQAILLSNNPCCRQSTTGKNSMVEFRAAPALHNTIRIQLKKTLSASITTVSSCWVKAVMRASTLSMVTSSNPVTHH